MEEVKRLQKRMWELQVGLKANMSKAGKSHTDVLLHVHHMQWDYSALQGTGSHTAGELDLVLHGLNKSNKNKRDLSNMINQK